MVRTLVLTTVIVCIFLTGCQSSTMNSQTSQWQSIFDGKTLNGWTANENVDTFSVKDGTIMVKGDRSHLFYTGPVMDADFTDFEWKADVMTMPNANSGMYFHTEYQDSGWPQKGYEVQVNNSHSDWKRTGGLYAVKDVKVAPAKDKEWFTQHIIVNGKRIIIKVDGVVTVDYTEPAEVSLNGQSNQAGRKISNGTIAIQGHDPGSVIYYKNIMVKPLP